MQFDNLEELKFFLRDYSVRHHRPYNVIHSSAKTKYTVACQKDCSWKVWAHPLPDDRNKRRIARVIQPHTCGMSEVAQEHSQCKARYISRWIVGMVYKDPDVSIDAIIESIKAFSNYTVNYMERPGELSSMQYPCCGVIGRMLTVECQKSYKQ
jgi:hypothetical protein